MNKIKELRHYISESIAELINNDYLLLDLPFHNNLGDILIWRGEEDFLKTIPFKCVERGSKAWKGNPVDFKEKVILLHGGGNFGELYIAHQQFRLDIIQKFPENRIIIFPQSVWYEDENNAIHDADICGQHKDLTICARDQYSYDYLKRYFSKNNILLVPDMAFFINDELLNKYRGLESNNISLFFRRIDKEITESTPSNIEGCDIHDWPTVELSANKEFGRLERLSSMLPYNLGRIVNSIATQRAKKVLLNRYPKIGLEFLAPYSKIVTTRLHALILSFLLGKKICYIDNTTRKLSSFSNTWLADINTVRPYKSCDIL